jgi:predicted O-methyltransferase YrrM
MSGEPARHPLIEKPSYNRTYLAYVIRTLTLSLINPKTARQIICNHYYLWKESKAPVYRYTAEEQSDIRSIIRNLFQNSNLATEIFETDTSPIRDHVESFIKELGRKKFPSKAKPYPLDFSLDEDSGLFLYSLCKIIKPKAVLETGVAYGMSSAYILQALHENNSGILYSIDSIFRPWETKEMIGAAIPPHLRSNWKLVLGTTSEKLKEVLSSIGEIDIFIHDSLHSYKNMLYEYEAAWPFIKERGLLISDDVSANNAFHDFCMKLELKPFILPQKKKSFLGILQKP